MNTRPLHPTPEQVLATGGGTISQILFALIATLTGVYPQNEKHETTWQTASKHGLPLSRLQKVIDGLVADGSFIQGWTSNGYGGAKTAKRYVLRERYDAETAAEEARQSERVEAKRRKALLDAYNAVFDWKDRQGAGTVTDMLGLTALSAVRDLLTVEGVAVPHRFDAKVTA